MDRIEDFTGFSEILKLLAVYCKQKKTGKLFLTTDQNFTASVSINLGEVCAVTYRIYKSMRALEKISEIKQAKYRFDYLDQVDADVGLPSTTVFFEQLGVSFEASVAAGRQNGDLRSSAKMAVTQAQMDRVESVLVDLVGPIAKSMCKLAAEQAVDMSSFVKAVSEKIPDSVLLQQFENNLK